MDSLKDAIHGRTVTEVLGPEPNGEPIMMKQLKEESPVRQRREEVEGWDILEVRRTQGAV